MTEAVLRGRVQGHRATPLQLPADASGRDNTVRHPWIGPTLVECLVGDATDDAGPLLQAHHRTAPGELIAAAAHHNVAMALWEKLPSKDGEPSVMRNFVRRSAARHLLTLADLRRLVGLFDRAGIASVALKGPVLAELAYARPHLRTYADLDLLIEPASLPVALEVLHGEGASSIDYPWDRLMATGQSQLSVLLASGTALDLHWDYFNDPSARRAFPIPASEIVGRSVRVDVAGVATPVQEPTDRLLHVCVHATLSGGFRLCWSQDVRRLLLTSPPDWDLLIERARASGTALAVGAMLARAGDVLAAPVPEHVVDALAGGPWMRLARGLTRYRPPQSESVLTGNFFYAATRRSSLGSARQLATTLWRGALSPVLHDPDHPWRHHGHRRPVAEAPVSPRPLGGADDSRDRFLRWVEAPAGA